MLSAAVPQERQPVAVWLKLRSVLGISGWRKVCLYSDLTQMMLDEGRVAGGADVGDRLIKLMTEDGVSLDKINAVTSPKKSRL